jgi:hypothetical protein
LRQGGAVVDGHDGVVAGQPERAHADDGDQRGGEQRHRQPRRTLPTLRAGGGRRVVADEMHVSESGLA